MTFFEDIQAAQDLEYQKWFTEWMADFDLKNKLLRSAKEGFTGYIIEIEGRYKDVSEKDAKYLKMDKTLIRLRETLGEEFYVNFHYKTYTHILTEKEYEYKCIRIAWGNE